MASLAKATRDVPGTGWVRGNFVASEDVLAQLTQVRAELDKIRAENEYLKTQLLPDVKGIAKLAEPFEIRYTHYDDRGNYKYNKTLLLSWADIFKCIAPDFFSPHPKNMIEHALKRHISEMQGGHYPRSMKVYASDIDTIKLQMIAHGFLHVYSARSTQGGMAEFIQLTEGGKRVLIELSAVRSS